MEAFVSPNGKTKQQCFNINRHFNGIHPLGLSGVLYLRRGAIKVTSTSIEYNVLLICVTMNGSVNTAAGDTLRRAMYAPRIELINAPIV